MLGIKLNTAYKNLKYEVYGLDCSGARKTNSIWNG